MPTFKIETNIPRSKIAKDFVSKLLPVLSDCVKKPVEWFVVSISTDCIQSMLGDEGYSVVASLEAVGLSAEKGVIAADVTDFLELELGVQRNRIVIGFYDRVPSNVAKGGVTLG